MDSHYIMFLILALILEDTAIDSHIFNFSSHSKEDSYQQLCYVLNLALMLKKVTISKPSYNMFVNLALIEEIAIHNHDVI